MIRGLPTMNPEFSTWPALYDLLFDLRHRARQPLPYPTTGDPSAVAVLTFRLATDGVAQVLAKHLRALKTADTPDTSPFQRTILISGAIDTTVWNPAELADNHWLIPALALNTPLSTSFYSPITQHSDTYHTLPHSLLRESRATANMLTNILESTNVQLLIIENVNSLPYNISASL